MNSLSVVHDSATLSSSASSEAQWRPSQSERRASEDGGEDGRGAGDLEEEEGGRGRERGLEEP